MNRNFNNFSLTHPETNPQLEPLRRVIESGVPTRDCDYYDGDKRTGLDPDVTEAGRYLSCTTGFDRRDARFIAPERYKYTSLENPLLFNLTADEYRTLK